MASFLNINLIIDLKCLDCGKTSQFKFRLGNYFNLEGDLLDVRSEQTIYCSCCQVEVFCDLKKIYYWERILKYYDGLKTFKEENRNCKCFKKKV